MAGQSAQPATNERIMRLLEEVKARLDSAEKRDERIAKDLRQLLDRG